MEPSTLIRLCYVSEASLSPDQEPAAQIQAILHRSRWWNQSVGITGSLFFNRTLFAQVLEGPVRQVERLFEQIKRDPRHRNAIRVDWRMIEERQFGQWSMAFVGSEESQIGLYRDFLLDERLASDLARDNMLNLLVNIVRNREAGLGSCQRSDSDAPFLNTRDCC